MNTIKTLHIFNDPKFSPGFFNFLIKHDVDLENHYLFHYRCKKGTCDSFSMNHTFATSFFSLKPNIKLLHLLLSSEKVIIHGLASPFLLLYLSLFKSLGKKSYWAIWGKDLYFFRVIEKKYFYHYIYEFFRKKAIKNISHIIGYTEADVRLLRRWYETNATLHRSFMYPSNLYKKIPIKKHCTHIKKRKVNILVGNSADPSNNHLDIFYLLKKYSDEDISIISPLSYGNKKYAEKIRAKGNEMFGDKFKSLDNLIPYDEYINLLNNIDIALFGHKRSQAFGNIITLLGLGKKVYIHDSITPWDFFNDINIHIFNLNSINIETMNEYNSQKNIKIIKDTFSEKKLLNQINDILYY